MCGSSYSGKQPDVGQKKFGGQYVLYKIKNVTGTTHG